MTVRPTDSPYLKALENRVLIYDGAMGTSIQRFNLTPEDFVGKALEGCNDNLVLTRPDVIQAIHESFLAVGVDVVETCTFQSTPRRLAEWGLGDKVREINIAAARIARAAADKYSTPDKPRFVAASMGPTGSLRAGLVLRRARHESDDSLASSQLAQSTGRRTDGRVEERSLSERPKSQPERRCHLIEPPVSTPQQARTG